MPKVLIYNNIWIFIIYATDKYENRRHVHAGKKDMTKLCKIWLEPNVEIAIPGELSKHQQNDVLKITKDYQYKLIEQWNNFINGITVEIIKIK